MKRSWKSLYESKKVYLDDAISAVKRGARVFVGTAYAEPQFLVQGLIDAADRLSDVQIMHFFPVGESPYTDKRFDDRFRHNAFFIGPNTRDAVNEARADYTPVFISEIPGLFSSGIVPVDVTLIQTSSPDAHGFMSLGISVDITKSAARASKTVIAQVNRHMPRTLGDSFLHISEVDYVVELDAPLPEFRYSPTDEVAEGIARNVAKLINDGDTVHLGFGHIPNGVLKHLNTKSDLGIHTEAISDGYVDLIENGNINGSKKTLLPGQVVCSFCMGGRELYEYIDNNPRIGFHPAEFVYNPLIIARNENMISIGSALEVDFSGQVCSESKGYYFYSGIGGRLDFIRGAAMAKGGRSIIAMPSTTKDGEISRIQPHLREGAGVVATRGDVKYVVTEYGIAYLHGKSVRERAMALITIAHPKFRAALLEEAKKRSYVYSDQILVDAGTHSYPDGEEGRATIKDGTRVGIRPIKPTDEPLLQDFFYSHSDETIYRRYFRTVRAMPHRTAQTMVNLDYRERMAFVAALGEIGMERIIGVARYAPDEEHPGIVETAYTIHEDYQGKGLGPILQNYLENYAQRQGFKGMSGYLFQDNTPMLKVYEQRGALNKENIEGGVIRVWRLFGSEP